MKVLNLLEKFAAETFRLFIEISPYLILGFFFAGLVHTFLGEKYIRKHFSKSGIWAIIKASIFGIPLPVCSCAVIPLAESLRRDGASKSATMSFLVSTPSSGIDSVLATYALMGPAYAVFRPIASFLSGLLVGIVTHLTGKGEEKENQPGTGPKETPDHKPGKKSLGEIFNYGFREIPAEISRWLIIGVLVGGAISALVPGDFGSRYLLGSPVLNYAVILVISIPLYVCATGSIPIAAALIAKGVLPGAALALLIAGPATNSVTITFVYKRMGRQTAIFYIVSIIAASVVTGLIFDALWTNAGQGVKAVGAAGVHLPHSVEIAAAVLMALIFVNSRYGPVNFFKPKPGKPAGNKNLLTVKVPDMNCQHCKMKITGALEQMPGVRSVSIDLDAREVSVESTLDRKVILERIEKEGFRPR